MHRGPRLVLALGVALGGAVVWGFATHRSGLVASSYLVYHHAALAVLAGESLYAAPPPSHPGFTYMYPPATVLAYVPLALLPWRIGLAIQTLATLAAVAVLAGICVRTLRDLGVEVTRVDLGLVTGFCLLSPTAFPSVAFGNVNLLLAAAVAVGLAALEADRQWAGGLAAPWAHREWVAGAALGAVAAVKVFPALLGVWLLRRRSVRGVVGAILTGAGVLAVGLLVFGLETTVYYVTDVLFPRAGGDEFVAVTETRRAFLTLHRPLLLLVDLGPVGLVALSVAVVAPLVGYCYTTVATPLDRLVAAFVTVAAALVVVPSYYVYYPLVFYPLIPLCYLLDGRPRVLVLAGGVLGTFAVTMRSADALEALLPRGVAGPALDGLDAILTVVTPPTLGLVVAMLGCCLYVRLRRIGRHQGVPSPPGSAAGEPQTA